LAATNSSPESIREKFTAALDELVAQIKKDRSILAAILCGSLSHDMVWAKSDIDLALVTIDDKKAVGAALVAERERCERTRVYDPARGVSQNCRGRDSKFVHAFAAGQGAAALYARPDHRPTVRTLA
jgi:hypothetical protein